MISLQPLVSVRSLYSVTVTRHLPVADFLQRLTPFMYTKNLTSAWASLRAMKFGSLTLALSRVLVTVVLLTGHSKGVLPQMALMSLSRNVEEGNWRYEWVVCGHQENCTIPINFTVFFYLFYVPQSFVVVHSPQFGCFFFFCWYGVSFAREGLELFHKLLIYCFEVYCWLVLVF